MSGTWPDPPTPGTPHPAETAAVAALAVPGVVGLFPGTFGEIATHLPGRRVPGVRTRSGPDTATTEVHIVALLGRDLRQLAGEVHRAVRDAVGGDVRVVVEDVAV
ncbi:hypothetical protein [Cellulomonas sp. S1-8]|uniref:hypothetical protein n=1 Tax=Cellulomonas sp. S1-8 TaxID=2904790 RepID=UPI0022445DB1|nr:hypothetical protein [Cellulomonas sp. S1-8]UZN03607.1 hypothetical protein OKX07_01275 [Cellulomonas sp. S1-8]